MKNLVVFGALALALFASPAARAQANQSVVPGTQVRVYFFDGLSTSVAHAMAIPSRRPSRNPWPSSATRSFFPPGAKIHGTVTSVDTIEADFHVSRRGVDESCVQLG